MVAARLTRRWLSSFHTRCSPPEKAGDIDVVLMDALKVTELPRTPGALVANLPYNVANSGASAPVCAVPEYPSRPGDGSGRSQRSVMTLARRFTVYPSVKANWYAEVYEAGVIGKNVFWPAPKINSGLVGSAALRSLSHR